MALTRRKKEALVNEISEKLDAAPIIYFTNFSGLSVAEANDLRGRFFEAGVDYKVCKNTLLELAIDRVGGLDDLKEHLSGPTAVAFSEEPAAPARTIKQFLEDNDIELPELKAAYIDGAMYGAGELDALAALKSKDELIGEIIALLQAPMANIVGGLQTPASTLAGVVKAIAERDEDAEA